MYSTYHVWKDRAEKTKDELTEDEERDISTTTVIAFLAFIAGLVVGCLGTNAVYLGG